MGRINYQQFYIDFQKVIIDRFANNDETASIIKEAFDEALKKQEEKVFYD